MVPRVRVYSAIYGEYDWPKSRDKISHPFLMSDPIMYTDSDRTAAAATNLGWEARVVKHHFESPHGDPDIVVPMLNHKYWKCHPEEACPDTDISIWIDGSIEPSVSDFMDICLNALGGDDWACCPHPSRQCIYPEAYYSATLTWRYDAPSILAQAAHYLNFHPPGTGLVATGINVRRHTPDVIELSHLWWDEILNWSHQDQISLPVLLRLWGDKVKWNMNLTWHKDWILHPHG